MNELLREWLLGITAAAMLLALTESLAPDGTVKRMVSLAGGLILVIAAVSPITKLDESTLSDLTRKFEAEVDSGSRELEEKNEFLYESIIQENTAAYILDKAEALGMNCSVSVSIAWDGELPKPHAARIRGRWTEEQRKALSMLLESELGIIPSLQYFEEIEQ